jgi:hypothetical protein
MEEQNGRNQRCPVHYFRSIQSSSDPLRLEPRLQPFEYSGKRIRFFRIDLQVEYRDKWKIAEPKHERFIWFILGLLIATNYPKRVICMLNQQCQEGLLIEFVRGCGQVRRICSVTTLLNKIGNVRLV